MVRLLATMPPAQRAVFEAVRCVASSSACGGGASNAASRERGRAVEGAVCANRKKCVRCRERGPPCP